LRFPRYMVLALFAAILLYGFGTRIPDTIPAVSQAYILAAQNEYSSQNVLTPILLSWRGFDTFGELIILFMATTAISFLSRKNQRKGSERKTHLEATRVTVSGVAVLQPLLFVFSVYIFSFGHLSPGGAFQGGVILGSGFVMWTLVHPNEELKINALSVIEAICGIAYLITALLGLILLGSFLDPGYLPFGEIGNFFSAAALPLMYIVIGIKVGVEMIKIVSKFRA